jgi:lycopene beta-cyclase
MYAMPLEEYPDGTYRVFMEETSLVGRGARRLSFSECRRRARKRLAFHGMTVHSLTEEEYCYIPMGGELPDRSQRVIAFGAAANTVHPSTGVCMYVCICLFVHLYVHSFIHVSLTHCTGYQACRMLASATDVAQEIGRGISTDQRPDEIAARTYNALWPKNNRRQRDFQVHFRILALNATDIVSCYNHFCLHRLLVVIS